MAGRYKQSEDILSYLRNRHTGAENFVPIIVIESVFGISGVTVRWIVNKLRCDGQPVCSDANGYFYAKNRNEINSTVTQLLSRTKKINDAARGLVLSHQIFHDGTEGSL
jgi:biotin operon repressor